MVIKKRILLIFTAFLISTILSGQQNNRRKLKIRQVIIYKLKADIKPGIKTRYSTYLKGGTLIEVIKEIKGRDGKIYLEFKLNRKKYYLLKKYTGEEPQKLRTSFSFDIGEEKLNKPLPFHYEPKDLKELVFYTAKGKKVFLRRKAAVSFIAMARAAERERIIIKAVLGYRSVGYYSKRYFAYRNIWGKFLPKTIKFPGLSILHTGVYVYLSCKENRYLLQDHFFFTKAYKWLIKNSQYYGFYFLPFNNSYDYKPYCLRYTGRTSLVFQIQKPASYKVNFVHKSIALRIFKKPGFKIDYLVIHDNENSATKAMKYALKKYGGHGIELINRLQFNKRNIGIKVGSKIIKVDPNRIFTDKNAFEDMRTWNRRISKREIKIALKKIREIRKILLKVLIRKKKRYLLAIHTNHPYGRLSVYKFIDRRWRKNYHIYINYRMNKKSFYYVTSYKDFLYLKKKKLNVICLKNWNKRDGSLAFQTYKHKIPYIVIECPEGNDAMIKYMVDHAIKLIKLRRG